MDEVDSSFEDMSQSLYESLEDPVYTEISDNIRPEFKPVWAAMHGSLDQERREALPPGASFFELLRFRKRLLAAELPQSKDLPPLPRLAADGNVVTLPEDQGRST